MGPATSLELPADIRRTIVRAVILPSWAVILILTLLFVTGLKATGPVQYAPFVLSLVVFGLPHGAVDHLVPGRLQGAVTARSVVGVALLYAALAAAYLVFWNVAPAAAFIFFILFTWFHWGQGDLYSQSAFFGRQHLSPMGLKVLMVVVRGGLPMLVPLLAFPGVYREVAGNMVGLFAAPGMPAWLFGPLFRVGAGSIFCVLALGMFVWSYRVTGPGTRTALYLDGVEVVLLAAYFAVVPPVISIGLYFCLWHSPRHIVRLMLLSPASLSALRKGGILPALKDFARDAAPLTLAALVLLAGLYVLTPGGVQGAASYLALYLVLISLLTLPHVAVVGLMDRRQGLWR
ncbi:MAG: Brp/Blh family beta-carotene 15,15'-dioxygenase [Rubrobacteraceae bacterium]